MSWFCALKVNRTIFQSSLFSCPNAHNRFLQIGIYVRLSASNKVEQLSLPFISVLLPLFQYPCVHGDCLQVLLSNMLPLAGLWARRVALDRTRSSCQILEVFGECAQLPVIPLGHPPCQAWSQRAPTLSHPSELRTQEKKLTSTFLTWATLICESTCGKVVSYLTVSPIPSASVAGSHYRLHRLPVWNKLKFILVSLSASFSV